MLQNITRFVAEKLSINNGGHPSQDNDPEYENWHDYVKIAQIAIKAIREYDKFHNENMSIKGDFHKIDCALIISKTLYGCDCKKEENQ